MSRLPVRLVLLLLVVLAGCSNVRVPAVEPAAPLEQPTAVSHATFDHVLRTVVDAEGLVDYAGLQAAPDSLDAYLRLVARTDPANLSEAEALALWMNAYNAYTLKLIIEHYPVGGIREIVGGVFIPRVNSPWEAAFATVGGTPYTLNEIEHGIIRERFDEPRIHYALVCAAVSCPPLRREAYTADRLDAQLRDQARTFLHDAAKNRIPADATTIRLSKIFKWYGSDFGEDRAALQRALAPHFDGDVRERLAQGTYDVAFMDYDWSLNGQE